VGFNLIKYSTTDKGTDLIGTSQARAAANSRDRHVHAVRRGVPTAAVWQSFGADVRERTTPRRLAVARGWFSYGGCFSARHGRAPVRVASGPPPVRVAFA
jgi:hypothetical protein